MAGAEGRRKEKDTVNRGQRANKADGEGQGEEGREQRINRSGQWAEGQGRGQGQRVESRQQRVRGRRQIAEGKGQVTEHRWPGAVGDWPWA